MIVNCWGVGDGERERWLDYCAMGSDLTTGRVAHVRGLTPLVTGDETVGWAGDLMLVSIRRVGAER